jgi:hypothetical protein
MDTPTWNMTPTWTALVRQFIRMAQSKNKEARKAGEDALMQFAAQIDARNNESEATNIAGRE